MTDLTELAARREIYRFLGGDITLRQLQRWVVQQTWETAPDRPLRAGSIQGDLELALSEYTGGARSLLELRLLLERMAETYQFDLGSDIQVRSSSFTPVFKHDLVCCLVRGL